MMYAPGAVNFGMTMESPLEPEVEITVMVLVAAAEESSVLETTRKLPVETCPVLKLELVNAAEE